MRFLNSVTEETELQLAAMADASDESMIFIRFNDAENYDATELASEAHAFLHRATVLFDRGECFNSGYTRFMADSLREPVSLFFAGNNKVLGGPGCPSEEAKARVLSRMQNWLKLVRSVILAEFPFFELVSTFKVFSLSSGAGKKDARSAREIDLRRLAQFFGLSTGSLRSEFEDHLPRALREFRVGEASAEAWKRAVLATQTDARRRSFHPGMTLLAVLFRLLAYAFSTSGVERKFATGKWLLGEHRSISDSVADDELQILEQSTAERDARAIELAQKEWAQEYSNARKTDSRRTRLDAGTTHRSRGKATETAWIATRRQAVASIASSSQPKPSSSEVVAKAGELATASWSEKHSKEQAFQELKEVRRCLDALQAGLLLPEEVAPEMQTALIDVLEDEKRRAAAYSKERARKIAVLAPTCRPGIEGKRIYVDPSLQAPPSQLLQHFRDHKARRCYNPAHADILIVPTLKWDDVDTLLRWCAVLNGSQLATRLFLESGGQRGAAVACKRSLSLKRIVWVSPGFATLHPRIADVLRACSGVPSSAPTRWKFVGEKQRFLQAAANSTRQRRDAEVLALVSNHEQTTDQDRPP